MSGTKFSPAALTRIMQPYGSTQTVFQFPVGNRLQIRGIAPPEILQNPDQPNITGRRCMLVLKDGSTTGLTIGQYAGLKSWTCDESGQEGYDLAVYNHSYNYDDKLVCEPFAAGGDSGSLVVDVHGRIYFDFNPLP